MTYTYGSGWWCVNHRDQRRRTGCDGFKITLDILLKNNQHTSLCIYMCTHVNSFLYISVMCWLQGCKNGPAPFLGRMSYKSTKPSLISVLYLNMLYTVLLFIRAPFYVLLVFTAMCSVFWLFLLSYQYLPSDWLERLL